VKRLTVLFDEECPLCVRCRTWMLTQDSYLPIDFLACSSAEARRRYGSVPWLGAELVVVSDEGDVWVGAAAFLMCLWALVEWRQWSYRLSGPTLAPMAERFFRAVSGRRRLLGFVLGPPACPASGCRVPHHGSHGAPYRQREARIARPWP
jgi:predicted DCC family thiol-disulfide oxidoreductase YuxK